MKPVMIHLSGPVIVALIWLGLLLFGTRYQSAYQNDSGIIITHGEYVSPKVQKIKIPKKDRMDLAWEHEFKITRDPALDRVPRQRLKAARAYADQLRKEAVQGNKDAISNVIWEERGPANVGGRTRALMWDPNDPQTKKVWAGGVSGGLWYTNDVTNPASSWHPINDFWDNIAITCLTYDPTDTQVFYLGTGEGWWNVDAVVGDGIWKTTDGGSTWNQLASTDGNSNFYYTQKVEVTGSGRVLAATNGGLFTSDDGGNNWTQHYSGYFSDIEIAANDDIYAGSGRVYLSGHIYKSTNHGDSWTDITPAGATERIELATAPSNANVVYAIASDVSDVSWLRRSTNGGNSWNDITVPRHTNDITCEDNWMDFTRSQAWYNLILAVHPTDDNIVIAGGIDLHKTTDSGSDWTPISCWLGQCYPYVHADQHAIAFRPGYPNEAIIGNDGGVFYSSNLGSSMTPEFYNRNVDYNITQYYACAVHPTAGSNHIIAGSQDNGSHLLNSAGIAAAVEVAGGDGTFCHIDQANPQYQFTQYTNSQFARSTDGGTTFTYVGFNSNGPFINPSDYDNEAFILYAGYSAGQFLRWNNPRNGTSVDYIVVPHFGGEEVSHVAVSPNVDNRVYFGISGNGRVIRMDDADGTPATANISGGSMPTTGTVSGIAIEEGNDNHLLVSYSNYGVTSVWETTNGGTDWAAVEGNLPDMPVRWVMFHPHDPTKALLATELGVWTTDFLNGSGTVWGPSNMCLANVRTDMLQYRPSDDLVVAATHGRGIFSSPSFTNAPAGTGVVTLNRDVYHCADTATITLLDGNASGSPTVTVTASDGDSETLSLTGASPKFSGSIPVQSGIVLVGNGTLEIAHNSHLTVTYNDADPVGWSSSQSAEVDCRADLTFAASVFTGGTCDADAILDDSEDGTLQVTVTNNETRDLNNVQSTLSSSNSNITLSNPTQSFGFISAGASTSANFPIRANDNVGCAEIADFSLNLSADGYPDTNSAVEFSITLEQDPANGVFTENWDDSGTLPTGWTTQIGSGSSNWQTSSSYRYSAPYSVFCSDETITKDVALVTPAIDLTASSVLSFYHRYNFELYMDGGVIEISTSGINGPWIDLGPYITTDFYDYRLTTLYGSPIMGRYAWTGAQLSFTQCFVDLSSFADKEAYLRFRTTCDLSEEAPTQPGGWWIDNIRVTDIITRICDATLCDPNQGLITFDQDSYQCGDTIHLTVTDANETNPIIATISSSSEPGGEPVTLTETGPDSGTYTGSIACAVINSAGVLYVIDGDQISVTYDDADNPDPTDTASAVCQSPNLAWNSSSISGGCDDDAYLDEGEDDVELTIALQNLEAGEVTNVQLTLSIETQPAIGLVEVTTNTASIASIAAGATESQATPFKLRYHAGPGDAAGQSVTLRLSAAADGFLSPKPIESTISLDLDGGVITTTLADWHFGTSAAPEQHNFTFTPDPNWDWTVIYGGPLPTGTCGLWSRYLHNACRQATSPVVDMTGYPTGTTTLNFDMWYNIENGGWDGGLVYYSVNSSAWTPLPMDYSGTIQTPNNCYYGEDAFYGNSGGWVNVDVDISSFANGNTFQLRWVFASDNTVYPSGINGWWIDEIKIENVAAGTGPDNTVDNEAPAWVSNPNLAQNGNDVIIDWTGNHIRESCSWPVVFNVYHSLTSPFTPEPSNLLESGITGLSYIHENPQPEVTHYYIIGAEDASLNTAANRIELAPLVQNIERPKDRAAVQKSVAGISRPAFDGTENPSTRGSAGTGNEGFSNEISLVTVNTIMDSFTATPSENRIRVEWITASEVGVVGFILERQVGAGEYAAISSLIPALGNAFNGAHYTFDDQNVAAATLYWYRLAEIGPNGPSAYHGPIQGIIEQTGLQSELPTEFGLAQNYPNPFNPTTSINYQLPVAGQVRIRIYNPAGQLVRILVHGHHEPGYYQAVWDATNEDSRDVASGVYFYRMEAGDFSQQRRMTLLR